MFLTRKHLSRRTLLKGAGVSLALPLLDAMIPAGTALAKTAAESGLRAGFFYLPHGAVQGDTMFGPAGDRWTPSGSGKDFKLNTITKSLEPFKKYVTSLGNIENRAWLGSQHVRNPATWLSGMTPKDPLNANMCATLDQVIADHIAKGSAVRSLQVSSETTVQQRSGNGGSYTTLSFRDATTPMPMEYNPRKIFIQLFGESNAAADKREQVAKESDSLLDLINEQTRALKKELGSGDRDILDDYLTSVRKVEKDIESQSKRFRNVTVPPAPTGVQENFDQQVKLVFDLIAIAYRADLTRVVSFMMVAEGTNQTYNHIGVPDSFHPLSHHANESERIDKLVKIQTWHMERFAEFLGQLAAIREGNGTLLDRAMFLYGSNMSNSDKHNNHPLPTLVVGGAVGNKKGRHIALPEPTPIANLHLTLLNKVGIKQKSFGDSTGTISL